jgi:hypothetical protein
MVVRFCAPADNEVAATSIAANVSDFTMFNLPSVCRHNHGLGNAFRAGLCQACNFGLARRVPCDRVGWEP